MGFGKKIYEEARTELERRRQTAEAAANERLERFYERCPEARDTRSAIAGNAAGVAKAVVQGGNVRAEIKKLQDRARELNAEYDRLLTKAGLTREEISPQYTCPHCKDTGFVDGRLCDCFRQLQRSIAYEKLSMDVPLEKSTFSSFDLSYYKDDPKAYRQMETILQTCKNYVERFRKNSSSLLFKGNTGLGKTHLSLAIAGEVIAKGFGVIYGSAQSFAVSLEKERFDRREQEDVEDTHSQLLSCDLLILDDLGAEFPSAYVSAALYDILNSRMLADKPTIISTNLSMKELQDRYGERLASRIAGYYGKLEFLGNDHRTEDQKRRQEAKK
ncbi:MAG: ATP-binding protein [Acutalibacter sp.]|nr:ATP-binding protein [Acutalibacter sp.]